MLRSKSIQPAAGHIVVHREKQEFVSYITFMLCAEPKISDFQGSSHHLSQGFILAEYSTKLIEIIIYKIQHKWLEQLLMFRSDSATYDEEFLEEVED